MRRLLQWITGVAILLSGASLFSVPIKHFDEISWYFVLLDTFFGGFMMYAGANLISKSIEK